MTQDSKWLIAHGAGVAGLALANLAILYVDLGLLPHEAAQRSLVLWGFGLAAIAAAPIVGVRRGVDVGLMVVTALLACLLAVLALVINLVQLVRAFLAMT